MSDHDKYVSMIGAALLLIAALGMFVFLHNTNTTSTNGGKREWIVTNRALNQITASPKSRAAISGDTIYAIGYNPATATAKLRGFNIVPTKSYKSEAQLESDVKSGKIPNYVKAVLYDNEPWKLTPPLEQRDPVTYYQRASDLAHTHQLMLIAAPVPNKIDPQIAKYADIVDVQAQYAQKSVDTYLSATQSVIQRIARSNPHVIILSGMSTNPPSGNVTPEQLLNIARSTYPNLVRGWWLNIPGQGEACPNCSAPQPQTAIKFLQLLGSAHN